MEVGTDPDSHAKRARGAFEQVEMWRQLSAVSRRCLDAAVACAVAAQVRAELSPDRLCSPVRSW